ncbi:MAG: hypothetical protein IPI67_19645 [Myxococcales bacterium]|nr:hypothetical protein [Myxococcales bacterium]
MGSTPMDGSLVEGNASAKEVLLRVRKLKAPNKLDFRWADSLDFTSLENVTAGAFSSGHRRPRGAGGV